jgi:DNA repair protein RadC
MTSIPTPYDAICDDVRRRGSPDGALLAVFLSAESQILLTVAVGEGTHHVDELFLRHLVAVVVDIGVAEVVLAVARASGRPTRIDKLLWRELFDRLDGAPTTLLDVVVVGESRWWSAARTTACRFPQPGR